MSDRQRRRWALIVALGGPLAWMALRGGLGLQVNVTPSLPYGLYALQGEVPARGEVPTRGIPARGDVVRACLPAEPSALALARGYLPAGPCPAGTAYVAKTVAALAGDTVRVDPSGTYVNGRRLPRSRPLERDRGGFLMTPASGRHVLRPGEVWLYAGATERSWDARYYGPVPDSLLRGVLRPLLTWGKAHEPAG